MLSNHKKRFTLEFWGCHQTPTLSLTALRDNLHLSQGSYKHFSYPLQTQNKSKTNPEKYHFKPSAAVRYNDNKQRRISNG